MNDDARRDTQRVRLLTGVPGLDTVLCGGLWRGGVYVLQGPPGSGKTILANQICAHVARSGGRAVYVSMLAESFTVMLAHLARLSFFDPNDVGDAIRYVSGYNALEEAGFTGLIGLVRGEAQRYGADVVVLDSLVPAREVAPGDLQFKRRLLDLQALGTLAGFVTLVLTSEVPERNLGTIAQMADGVIELADESFDVRMQRSLTITKLRGSESLRGRHALSIGEAGVRVFPRIETLHRVHDGEAATSERLTTGVPRLDSMLGGGLPRGSIAGLMGGPGSGKTSLALQFLAHATRESPGLLFGFFERPETLRVTAPSLGVDLCELERNGAMRLVWQPQGEQMLDELAHRLLDEVDAIRAKRVVIDGYEALVEANVHAERMTRFMTALAQELRGRAATTLITAEREEIAGLDLRRPIRGSSPIFDNLVVMRGLEQNARLVRLLSVAKVRGSAFDLAVYTFEIGEGGIRVGEQWRGGQEIIDHRG